MASDNHHRTLVLEGATLLDGTGGAPQHGATVVVRGDRIAAVGRMGDIRHPESASAKDARGKLLLPGPIDAHARAEQDWVLCALRAAGPR